MTNQVRKSFTLGQKIKFTSFILGFFLVVIFLIGEVVMRKSHKIEPYNNKTDVNAEFGWYPKPEFRMEYEAKDMGEDGKVYPVQYHTESNGFREWGDVTSDRQKILFIGDSYVQSVEVSNDHLFYNHIADSLNVEVFAFGQAGYGTFQEYLVLDKYIDVINPDLIVWQSCDNDFIDNHVVLEYNSLYQVGQRRPYLNLDGSVDYRQAKPKWREWVNKSLFLGLLVDKITTTSNSNKEDWTEKSISELKHQFKPYKTSVDITSMILSKMKARAGEIPIIGFTASIFEPQLGDMKECSTSNDIPFYDDAARGLDKIRWEGVKYYTSDTYHWNEAGQAKIAEFLIPIVQSHLPKTEVIKE